MGKVPRGGGSILTGNGARRDAVPAVGGGVLTADEVGQGARGGHADAEKGKEHAWADADPEAGNANAETSAGADGVAVAARARGARKMAQQGLVEGNSTGRAAEKGTGEANRDSRAEAQAAARQRVS